MKVELVMDSKGAKVKLVAEGATDQLMLTGVMDGMENRPAAVRVTGNTNDRPPYRKVTEVTVIITE